MLSSYDNLSFLPEARELASQQKMQSTESNLDEVERLRAKVDKLMLSLRTYEASEGQVVQAREDQEAALQEVEVLKLRLRARDEELLQSKAMFEAELQTSRSEAEDRINSYRSKKDRGLTKISSIPHSPHPVPAS